ncbi:MAG: pilus assembly protein [Selenomonadaceae bacterium]|nr:pilus assembly protein [Selenomonadaceae bacterium]
MFGKKYFNRRGQALVLYALLIPFFFLILGLIIDLGWYFYTVSRMQNAADAAVMAGAHVLQSSDDSLTVDKVYLIPDDDANFAKAFKAQEDSSGTNIDDIDSASIEEGKTKSMEYVEKNINTNKNLNTDEMDSVDTFLVADKGNNCYYYVVKLKETVGHLFLNGFFEKYPMEAPVVAIAKITLENIGSVSPEVIANWEVYDYYRRTDVLRAKYEEIFGEKFYTKAWNFFADEKNHYTTKNNLRTETVNVFDDVSLIDDKKDQKDKYSDDNVSYGNNGSSVSQTNAASNGIDLTSYTYNPRGNPYVAEDLDSIDIDFFGDIFFNESSVYVTGVNWDNELGKDTFSTMNRDKGAGDKFKFGVKAWSDNIRIISSINFDTPYPVRNRARANGDNIDILWARIESEPMYRYPDNPEKGYLEKLNVKDIRLYCSVRQIIINFNEDNTGEDCRPIGIIYTGPEKYDYNTYKSIYTREYIRDSQPVILNFKAPTNAIIYVPNSPVAIIGNPENFHGFIVAKSYVRLKTTKDFEAELAADSSKYEKGTDTYQLNTAVENPYYSIYNYGKLFANYNDIEEVEKEVPSTSPNSVLKIYGFSDNNSIMSWRDNGEPKNIKSTYTKITKIESDGDIEMYIDDYSNVQYMPIDSPPKSCGTFKSFNVNKIYSDNYKLRQNVNDNLFISGR